MISSEE